MRRIQYTWSCKMIKREILQAQIADSIRKYPITALLGPRQCGKTTMAKAVSKKTENWYFDLENPLDEARLARPQMLFESAKGIIILDEIQRKPELLPVLRVLADKKPLKARFLILGSASPDIIRNSSESLAGRVHFIDMGGFILEEAGADKTDKLWVRGGFPKSFLAQSEKDSLDWRYDLIRTFLERDILQLNIGISSGTLKRFWSMLAHYHGQIWNGSEIGGAIGISHTTARRYLDALCGTYMVRQLPPFFENAGKRVVKSPKVYLRDSGIFHALMNIPSYKDLNQTPKIGASWEGFALEQVLRRFGERDAYFWSTHNKAELDLLILRGSKRYGFEFKCADAPVFTKSMRIAMDDLKIDHLFVVYPGKESYKLNDVCDCIPANAISKIDI